MKGVDRNLLEKDLYQERIQKSQSTRQTSMRIELCSKNCSTESSAGSEGQ